MPAACTGTPRGATEQSTAARRCQPRRAGKIGSFGPLALLCAWQKDSAQLNQTLAPSSFGGGPHAQEKRKPCRGTGHPTALQTVAPRQTVRNTSQKTMTSRGVDRARVRGRWRRPDNSCARRRDEVAQSVAAAHALRHHLPPKPNGGAAAQTVRGWCSVSYVEEKAEYRL